MSYSTIVNQKLAFARAQLKTATLLLAENSIHSNIDTRLKLHAYFDAALLQLNKALIFFIAEVASSSDAKKFISSIPPECLDESLDTFLNRVSEEFPLNMELREFHTLLMNEGSWLSQLLMYLRSPTALADSFALLNAKSSLEEASGHGQLINVVDVSKARHTNSPDMLISTFIHEIQILIDRHRANLEEY